MNTARLFTTTTATCYDAAITVFVVCIVAELYVYQICIAEISVTISHVSPNAPVKPLPAKVNRNGLVDDV